MQPMLVPLAVVGLLATVGVDIASGAASSRAAVTPVQKVLQMLDAMLAKGKQEKHEEQVQFAAYKQWCDGTLREKANSVETLSEQIELLKADIQTAETDASTITNKVQELNADVATWTADEKAATKLREKEREEYEEAHEEHSKAIEALTKARQVLQAGAVSKKAISLLEGALSLDKLPKAKRVLAAFLASASADPADTVESEVYAYEARSTNILDLLEKLKDKFVEERSQLETEEMQRRHAHELYMQDLKNSVANAEQTLANKAQQKAKYLEKAAGMKADLADATSTHDDDQQYLTETKATCGQKEKDYEDRQRLRSEEIATIEKALELLSSDKVLGNADKYFPAMLQGRGRGAALVQVGEAEARAPTQQRAAEYLREQGERLNSRVLTAIAVRADEDPFTKVKKMIKDLIMRLMDEASEEATHKSWCDTELASNEQIRTARSTDVERLTSEIESLDSTIAQLTLDMADLSANVATTAQEVAEATKIREAEKAANEQTVQEARDAQTALRQAITLLKEFYDRASEATALVQGRSGGKAAGRQTPPPIFEAAYTGMGGESGGVIAMLEIIQSDYAKLESTTEAMEVTSKQDFDKSMKDTLTLKTQMELEIEHKKHQKQRQEQILVDSRNDLTSAQKELDAANNYYDKLKPSCVDTGGTFEERERRRQEEIQSLQEALRILNGEDIAVPT